MKCNNMSIFWTEKVYEFLHYFVVSVSLRKSVTCFFHCHLFFLKWPPRRHFNLYSSLSLRTRRTSLISLERLRLVHVIDVNVFDCQVKTLFEYAIESFVSIWGEFCLHISVQLPLSSWHPRMVAGVVKILDSHVVSYSFLLAQLYDWHSSLGRSKHES